MSDQQQRLGGEKPQYHYFYGSTDETEPLVDDEHEPRSPLGGDDQEASLAGEELIQTDNEEEVEISGQKADLQHLIVTNKNGGVHPMFGNGSDMRARNIFEVCSLDRLRDGHPLLLVFLLVASICIFFFILTVTLFPDINYSHSNVAEAEFSLKIPFPAVDRAEYGDPLSDIIDTSLFDSSLLHKGIKGGDPRHQFIFPFPTGAFWTNLVLAPPKAEDQLSYPIAVYPYAYKWSPTELQFSYPARHRVQDSTSIHDYFFPDLTFQVKEQIGSRKVTKFDPLSISLRFDVDRDKYMLSHLVQGSPYATLILQGVTPVLRALSIFSEISCPRDEEQSSQNNSTRRRLEYGMCLVNTEGNMVTASGVQFILQSQEGARYIIFASVPIILQLDLQSKTSIWATSNFSGVIRIAHLPESPNSKSGSPSEISVSSSSGLQRLIYHAGVYPTGAEVSWSFRDAFPSSSSGPAVSTSGTHSRRHLSSTNDQGSSSTSSTATNTGSRPLSVGRIGTLHFEYAAESTTPFSSASKPKPLLLLGLPHHIQSIATGQQLSYEKFDIDYRCIKGPMRPIIGSSWSYDEFLPTLGMEQTQETNATLLPYAVRRTILESLEEDIKIAQPTLTENVYGFGKQSARLAQIAYVASRIQERTLALTSGNTTKYKSHNEVDTRAALVSRKATDILYMTLDRFFTQNATDFLLYDSNFGGIVTSDGLRDHQADFGNGRYNDHHFHYGYILYASALLGSMNKSFIETHGAAVDAVYYDIAYSKNMASVMHDGVYLPGARHKSWFDGHSYASGLFPFANGKSQESSSEAVNAYYGAYLWSLVKHGSLESAPYDTSQQTDFARLLLATEIRGARTYWHMLPSIHLVNNPTSVSPTVYPAPFLQNFMVGNLGMLDAVCTTWFGSDPLYVNMINFLPVTSITAFLFDKRYVQRQFLSVLAPIERSVDEAWEGYVVSEHAIIDPNTAWYDALSLTSLKLDSGISKSQVLYWIATRPSFNVTTSSHDEDNSHSGQPMNETGTDTDDPMCSSRSQCAVLGLIGDCCPTSSGIMLDCC